MNESEKKSEMDPEALGCLFDFLAPFVLIILYRIGFFSAVVGPVMRFILGDEFFHFLTGH